MINPASNQLSHIQLVIFIDLVPKLKVTYEILIHFLNLLILPKLYHHTQKCTSNNRTLKMSGSTNKFLNN